MLNRDSKVVLNLLATMPQSWDVLNCKVFAEQLCSSVLFLQSFWEPRIVTLVQHQPFEHTRRARDYLITTAGQ